MLKNSHQLEWVRIPTFALSAELQLLNFPSFRSRKVGALASELFVYHANDHNLLRTQKFWFRAKNLKKHVPRRGIEPRPRRWERRILTTRPPGKVGNCGINLGVLYICESCTAQLVNFLHSFMLHHASICSIGNLYMTGSNISEIDFKN